MKETTLTAIVLKATDYRESDKLVRLLTTQGKTILAVFKGVKKQGAKLKYAAQPFSFCEFALVEGKSGFLTVISYHSLGDFFSITSDPYRYLCASLVLEAAESAAIGNENERIFTLTLMALKMLTFSSANANLVAACYLLQLLDAVGYSFKHAQNAVDEAFPQNLSQTMAVLQKHGLEKCEFIKIDEELALKAVKMQCGRYNSKLDTVLNCAKFLHK